MLSSDLLQLPQNNYCTKPTEVAGFRILEPEFFTEDDPCIRFVCCSAMLKQDCPLFPMISL